MIFFARKSKGNYYTKKLPINVDIII